MIYRVRLNKKVSNIKVYNVLKKSGAQQNAITKLFMRFFGPKKQGGAAEG
jgi:hypothetical protein